MAAKHAATVAVFIIGFVLCCKAEDNYEFLSDLTKNTWQKLQESADISSESDSLQQQYTGDMADDCRQQLQQQNYRTDLDKKMAQLKSKLAYQDRLLHNDELQCGTSASCKEEVETKYQRNMEADVTNANRYIRDLKKAALQNIKNFMDKCTQGTT